MISWIIPLLCLALVLKLLAAIFFKRDDERELMEKERELHVKYMERFNDPREHRSLDK